MVIVVVRDTPTPEVRQDGAEFPIRTEGPDCSGRRLSKPLLLAYQPTQHKWRGVSDLNACMLSHR